MAEQQATTIDEVKRNVLICVDGSEHSERAFNFYLEKLCRKGDHVIVFHVQDEIPLPAKYPFGAEFRDDWRSYTEEQDDKVKKLLRHFGAIIKDKPDITFKLVKERGAKPGELICKNIKEEGSLFAVIGSRGLGTLQRKFMGSVSDYVVHHADVTVCVVPPMRTTCI